MAYTHRNFKTGAALKRAFLAGEQLSVFQPGPFGPDVKNGPAVIEGPHYPEAHRFYVAVDVKDGRIVKVRGR
jgi:hypothetical protein